MKLSTRSTYGMRALVELAFASGRGPVSASHIARRQELSVAYLEQLLHRLKRHGVVSSIRGPRGGYLLARDPTRITMADVVHMLEGLQPARKISEGPLDRRRVANGHTRTHRSNGRAKAATGAEIREHAQRVAQVVVRCVYDRVTESLGAVTLQDLCDEVRTEAGEPLDHRYVFHI